MLLKQGHGVSPVVINGYYITNAVCWSCLMSQRDTILTVSNTTSLMLGQPTHIVHQRQRWKAARTMRKALIPPRTLLAKNLVLSLSFLAFPPFSMFSLSHAQWMKSGIASFTGADLSHVFKGSHSKSFFFLAWKEAYSVDLSYQKRVETKPPLHCHTVGSSAVYI